MLGTNINNYIDSWHRSLKENYVESHRKKCPEVLVYNVPKEVVPDLRIQCDFTSRRMTVPEKYQLTRDMVMPPEVAATYVHISDDEIWGQESSFQVVTVRSFKDRLATYKISLNDSGLVSRCAYPYVKNNLIVCKHMYIARHMYDYRINFDARNFDKSVDSLLFSSLPYEPTADRKLIEDNI